MLFDKKEQISDQQKLEWIRGIAAGMLHLHKHNIVHRDLAARNILLTNYQKNSIPKISVCILSFLKIVSFFLIFNKTKQYSVCVCRISECLEFWDKLREKYIGRIQFCQNLQMI
jgi:serine/threonine protein kinase